MPPELYESLSNNQMVPEDGGAIAKIKHNPKVFFSCEEKHRAIFFIHQTMDRWAQLS